MTQVLITIETELSPELHAEGVGADENFSRSVLGETRSGESGIGWQMDCLERHGLKGVFMVDPMAEVALGAEIVARMVSPLLARGHEIQLHLHTEWLDWAKEPLTEDRRGAYLSEFSLEDQVVLLNHATGLLTDAGARRPIAFRAGDYGANDDTLKALAAMRFAWDSSFNPAGAQSAMGLGVPHVDPVRRFNVSEIPVAGIVDSEGAIRPALLSALSAADMRAALRHAAETQRPAFAIAVKSHDMVSHDGSRANRSAMRRFESLCKTVAHHHGLDAAGFADLDPDLARSEGASGERLATGRWRSVSRSAQQLFAAWMYEHRLRPAA